MKNIVIVTSGILNIVLGFMYYGSQPSFISSQFWSGGSFETSGIFIFSDKKKQPKSSSQYLKIYCQDKNCTAVEAHLTDRKLIAVYPREITLEALSYENKQATLNWEGCIMNVGEKSTTFNCKDGDAGILGPAWKL